MIWNQQDKWLGTCICEAYHTTRGPLAQQRVQPGGYRYQYQHNWITPLKCNSIMTQIFNHIARFFIMNEVSCLDKHYLSCHRVRLGGCSNWSTSTELDGREFRFTDIAKYWTMTHFQRNHLNHRHVGLHCGQAADSNRHLKYVFWDWTSKVCKRKPMLEWSLTGSQAWTKNILISHPASG